MKKITLLLAAMMAVTMSFAATDYSTVYTSNVTLTAGSNGSAAKVKIGNTSYNAIKLGTSSKTGTMTIKVPADSNVLYLHAAAWKGTTCTLNITTAADGVTLTPDTWSPKANSGVTGSSTTFTFSGDVTSDYFCKVKVNGNTAGATVSITTTSSAPRVVVWGVNAAKEAEVAATEVKLNKKASTIELYKRDTLAATLAPEGATTAIVWSSSDASVATVANGIITAKTLGTTKIIATAGAVADTCEVTVTNATPITVAQAAEIAQTVSANNEIAAGGMYVIHGYVTEIAYAYKNGSMSVWMADTKDGGRVFEAYKVIPVAEVDTTVTVGDYVEVIGDITKYNTTYETSANGSILIVSKAQYTIIATVNDETMGTVTGEGSYDRDSEVTLTATANEGYEFVNWTNAANDTLGTEATLTFTATKDSTIKANFKEEEVLVPATWYGQEALTGTLTGKDVTYSITYDITRNADKTLTMNMVMTGVDGVNFYYVALINATGSEMSQDAKLSKNDEGVYTGTTTKTYKDGDVLTLKIFMTTGQSTYTDEFTYTVGSSNNKPTAIDTVSSNSKATKRIVNGVLVIEKNGVRYNAQGVVME